MPLPDYYSRVNPCDLLALIPPDCKERVSGGSSWRRRKFALCLRLTGELIRE